MNLKEKLTKLRKENNLTQEKLADKLYISRQTVSNWENGKFYPDIETLILISNTFNISLDYLLKDDVEMVKSIDKKIKSHRKLIVTIIALLIVLISSIFIGYKYHSSHKKIIKNVYTITIPENRTLLSINKKRILNENIDEYINKKVDIYIEDSDDKTDNNIPVIKNAKILKVEKSLVVFMVEDDEFYKFKQYDVGNYDFIVELIAN